MGIKAWIHKKTEPTKPNGEDWFDVTDKNIKIEMGTTIRNVERVHIGRNVTIRLGTVIDGGEKTRYHDYGVHIGDNSWIGEFCYLHGAGRIEISENVGIGPHVKILTSQHKRNDEQLTKPVINIELEFKKVVIKRGADIGMGSIILPGITIGYGAIVGAGSVVTKDVEDYAVVAGNPVKLIRMRTDK